MLAINCCWVITTKTGGLFFVTRVTSNPQLCNEHLPKVRVEQKMGHVFVAIADIRYLSCDAWIMPFAGYTLYSCSMHNYWMEAVFHKLGEPKPLRWELKARLDKAIHYLDSSENIGKISIPDTGDLLDSIAQILFLKVLRMNQVCDPLLVLCNMIRDLLTLVIDAWKKENKPKLNRRDKYLIAVPVFGTGGAGFGGAIGSVAHAILDCLLEISKLDSEFDYVLCTIDTEAFVAAQNYRLNNFDKFFGSMPHLTNPDKMSTIVKLAELAAEGKLALFIGAGVSVGAGMPSWGGLLEELAKECAIDVSTPFWISSDYLSKADIIEKKLKAQGKNIGDWIASRMNLPFFSIQHALLASLKSKTVVTTNYDICFESSVKALEREVSVIPHRVVQHSKVNLLKMHGCVTVPKHIVLTRKHYIRYMERNAALAGIVQTALLTSHLLFIGFSLDDENFHKIMDSVKKSKATIGNYGTTIQLFENTYLADLWHPDIDAVFISKSPDRSLTGKDYSEAGRGVDLYLDLLSAHTSKFSYSHLLDERFCGIDFTEEEEQLHDHLLALARSLVDVNSPSCAEVLTYINPVVGNTLKNYGFKHHSQYFVTDLKKVNK